MFWKVLSGKDRVQSSGSTGLFEPVSSNGAGEGVVLAWSNLAAETISGPTECHFHIADAAKGCCSQFHYSTGEKINTHKLQQPVYALKTPVDQPSLMKKTPS